MDFVPVTQPVITLASTKAVRAKEVVMMRFFMALALVSIFNGLLFRLVSNLIERFLESAHHFKSR